MTDTSSESETELIADNTPQFEDFSGQLDYFRRKTNLISQAKFKPTSIKQVNMTEPQIIMADKSEIQLLLHALPEFSPGQNLSIFTSEVDNLLQHLEGRVSPDLLYLVNFSIRSKIKGDARDYVAHQNATEWKTIRNALIQKYGDQRSEELLVSALRQCVQQRNETYLDFYTKLLKCFNDLIQNISLHNNDPHYLAYKKIDYAKLALKTFQIGLLEPYRTYISNFELTTIDEYLNKCKLYDNRKQEWEYCDFIRRSQSPYSQQKSYPSNSMQLRRFHNPVNRSFNQTPSTQISKFSPSNASRQQNAQFRGFPNCINQPISPTNNTFTNKHVFGTKPASNISKVSSNKPTPMSIQSRVYSHQMPSRTGLFNVESDNADNENDIHFAEPDNNYCETANDNCGFEESAENFYVPASEQLEQ